MRSLVSLAGQSAALVSIVALGLAASGSLAHADGERTSPLEGAPEIRHRYELREDRFELEPAFEASIGADYKTTLSGGLKLEYHLNDWFSIGGMAFYGAGINTGLLNQVVASLPTSEGTDPTPTQDQVLQHANTIPLHGGLGVTLTPWAGKISLFGKVFIDFDVYVSGGFGFALTQNTYTGGDNDVVMCGTGAGLSPCDPRADGPHNAGFNPGVQFGGGFHFFFGQTAALDLYLRDYMFTDNPSGFDYNGDNEVTDADRRFLSHLFVGLGVSIYLPGKAKISK